MCAKLFPHAAHRHLCIGAGFLLVPLVAARLVALFYSDAATNVLYMDTLLPTALYWIKQLLTVIAFGAAIALIASSTHRFGSKYGGAAFGMHTAALFLDFLAAFLIDVLSGAVGEADVSTAFMVGFFGFLWSALFSLIAYLCALRTCKKERTEERAVLFGSAFYMAGWLVLELWYLIEFLISVDFLPYPTEIVVIAGEFLRIIVLDGGVLWIVSLFALYLLSRFERKTEKFTNNL